MALPPQIINSRFAVPALAAASAVAVLIGNRSGLAVGDDGVGYEAIAAISRLERVLATSLSRN